MNLQQLFTVAILTTTISSTIADLQRTETHAQDALSGVYTECFAQVSFPCLQRKVLQFLHRMSRMEKFDLFGKYLSVVRTRDDSEGEQEFQARLASAERENALDQLMESTIDRFFTTHVIRVQLPNSLAVVAGNNGRSADSVDLQFPESNEIEARKKGGGGGGKMGKKMMMMMMMGLKAKLMMLGPMMMGLAGLMAMKALIAGVVSLTISKIMIIKKLMKQKQSGGHSHGGWESSSGGGGGGWSSGGGGGGGWDRRSDDITNWEPANLAYRAYSTLENLL